MYIIVSTFRTPGEMVLVGYHFFFVMYSNLAYVTFILYLYSFFFYSPRWRFFVGANRNIGQIIIHHLIFVIFIYFPITLPAVRISLLF